MSDTDELIKNVAFDVMSVVTLWGLSTTYRNPNFSIFININTYKFYLYSHEYPTIIALGTSFYIMSKYFDNRK